MDLVNRTWTQLSDLFRSMTPAARITSGLLLIVVVISFAYLVRSGVGGPDAFLMGGEPIPSSQLPTMEAAFAKAGLTGYEIQGNRIRVPRGQQATYMAALADADALPLNFGDSLRKALDQGGIWVSRTKQADMLKVALQEELARIIRSMRGIEAAAVLYDVQAESGPSRRKTVTASVSVQPQAGQPLDEERVQAIRHLVAAAIAGLSPEAVAVTDLQSSRVFPAGPGGSTASGSQDPYVQTKLKYERDYQHKIREALAFVPGAVVSVNVELNPELENVENSTEVDPKTVSLEVIESSRTSSSQAPAPAGRPGLVAQRAIPNQGDVIAGSALGPKSEEESADLRQRNISSATTTRQSRKAGLTPRRVTASIGIPSSYFEQIWQQRQPASSGDTPAPPDANALAQIEADEKSKIQKYVSQLIPIPQGVVPDVTPLVTVTTFQHLPPAPIAPPGVADEVWTWLNHHWATLGLGMLALASLALLRSLVRAVPMAAPLPTTLAGATAASEPSEPSVPAAPKPKRRPAPSRTLRDDMIEIVREDPDAAASVLRNWIGNAS